MWISRKKMDCILAERDQIASDLAEAERILHTLKYELSVLTSMGVELVDLQRLLNGRNVQ